MGVSPRASITLSWDGNRSAYDLLPIARDSGGLHTQARRRAAQQGISALPSPRSGNRSEGWPFADIDYLQSQSALGTNAPPDRGRGRVSIQTHLVHDRAPRNAGKTRGPRLALLQY